MFVILIMSQMPNGDPDSQAAAMIASKTAAVNEHYDRIQKLLVRLPGAAQYHTARAHEGFIT